MSLKDDFRNRRGYFLAAVVAVILDQATKLAAVAALQGKGQVQVIPGFLNLWFSTNRGGLFGSFGNLDEPWRTLLLVGMPLVFVVGMVLFLARTDEPDRATLFGLAMMLGGAVGNLLDRVFRGEVVDFLDVYASNPRMASFFLERFGTVHWPTFNVADSAIVVGAALLLLDVFRPAKKEAKG
jgi:signal peptidase II